MKKTLGDAFALRKKIDNELNTWINRLALASRNAVHYKTKAIEGDKKFQSIPGSKKIYTRNYTIEECREKIQKLIAEDQKLALLISLTNQKAKAKVIGLDGKEEELTIPELLVLRNEIAPKIERAARAIPTRASGVEIVEEGKDKIEYRIIKANYVNKQIMGEKGNVLTNKVIEDFNIEEVEDYGLKQREVFDNIDEIHAWMFRIKEAINMANKTELEEL
ncbi:MAG: hypothetical protein ACTSPM_01440 [Candidatus Heimdallarchaeota archaeon]